MEKVGIATLKAHYVKTVDEGIVAGAQIGYPLMLRPSYILGGGGTGLVYGDEELVEKLENAFKASPTQFDIGVKTTYDDKLWFGGGYRTNGDILCLLGYTINERYMLGYSYDISTGEIGTASNGSHEFMLGIKFITNRESDIMKAR